MLMMQHHHHGAEDGREDAALGVRLARVVGQELPEPAAVDAEPAEPGRARSPGRRGRCRARAGPSACPSAVLKVTSVRPPSPSASRAPAVLASKSACCAATFALEPPPARATGRGPAPARDEVELALLEARLLDPVVDVADLVLLDRLDRVRGRARPARSARAAPARAAAVSAASTCSPCLTDTGVPMQRRRTRAARRSRRPAAARASRSRPRRST